jgi:hypothetical protein
MATSSMLSTPRSFPVIQQDIASSALSHRDIASLIEPQLDESTLINVMLVSKGIFSAFAKILITKKDVADQIFESLYRGACKNRGVYSRIILEHGDLVVKLDITLKRKTTDSSSPFNTSLQSRRQIHNLHKLTSCTPDLKQLVIRNNDLITSFDCKPLAKLSKLETLHMHSLMPLELGNANYFFSSCAELTHLSLNGIAASDENLINFLSVLPKATYQKIKSLIIRRKPTPSNLPGNPTEKQSDKVLQQIKKFTHLEYLDLDWYLSMIFRS